MQIIRHASQPVEHWRPGVVSRMLVSAQVGSRQICIFEQWCAPHTGAPGHYHPVEEVLTVLSGTLEVWLGDQRARLVTGEAIVIPAGVDHGFHNPGPEDLHLQAVLAAAHFTAVSVADGSAVIRWAT